jgi:hypothetical protein
VIQRRKIDYTNDRFHENWAEKFPDPLAFRAIYDIKSRGSLLEEKVFVSVDGGRVDIPLPKSPQELVISRRDYQLGRIVNRFTPYGKDYEIYLQRAGINRVSTILQDKVANLRVTDAVRESIYAVLTHPEYPRWMSISGTLVQNPIWNDVSQDAVEKVISRHDLSGPSAPMIMHLDLLLMRRDGDNGRGEIYTYPSPDWQTHLLTFRPNLPEDDFANRAFLNSKKLVNYLPGEAEKIKVTQLPNKYIVSVKPNPKTKDLIIYVFEVFSVLFPYSYDDVRETFERKGKWFLLKALRADQRACAVNGDVLRAMHEMFSATMDGLPASFANER